MATDTQALVKVLDEAITNNDVEAAIKNHGDALSEEEKDAIRRLSVEQMKDTLKNLKEADRNLNRVLFIDTNNNNN